MKTISPALKALFSLAVAVFVTCSFTEAGSGWSNSHGGTAELIVWRVADFGTEMSLQLSINGEFVTSMMKGQGYRAVVRSGRHEIAVRNSPSPYGKTRVTKYQVNMQPGQSYAFTAIWQHADTLVLEPADPNHPPKGVRIGDITLGR